MKHTLTYPFYRVTEAAAIAGFAWLGRGDKNLADGAAVAAMRQELNALPIDGTIVIGEGEIDEAPMLYIGEKVGQTRGPSIDIAVDPIEGTRMTACGQSNALSVMAVAEAGTLLHAPDMYMEKLIVGPKATGVIDLHLSLAENLRLISQALQKPLNTLTISILDKPRHAPIIADLHRLGVRVFTFPDGDVSASLLTCFPDQPIDVMYGIGGAPEGVISAAAVRALGGDMQARLLTRIQVKGAGDTHHRASQEEEARCQAMGLTLGEVLRLDDLAKSDNVLFSATGITDGDLLAGIRITESSITTHSLVIDGQQKTLQWLKTVNPLAR
ncbi:class II fructose-bisphosphatase [Tatumella sp. TA1]|uniref:class II fructose-bisphosphatase n=1 Tax=Rosenbergiella collisarenosi TaxID=1544695 RepID=UPI0008F93EC6|nr:class II fructose-bisphosphatase [Rosenbergiella collisarenosi]QGX92850.1 class II fructose-bisphosphatase [Tatumella sp. TA1]